MVTKIAFVDENRLRFLPSNNDNGGNDAEEHQAALRLEKNILIMIFCARKIFRRVALNSVA